MYLRLRDKWKLASVMLILVLLVGMVGIFTGCGKDEYALHDPLTRFKIATTTSL